MPARQGQGRPIAPRGLAVRGTIAKPAVPYSQNPSALQQAYQGGVEERIPANSLTLTTPTTIGPVAGIVPFTVGAVAAITNEAVQTPEGVVQVSFSAGKPVAITKNLVFTQPVSQALSPTTTEQGTATYTYNIQNNSLVATPTSVNASIYYQSTTQAAQLAAAQSLLAQETNLLIQANALQKTNPIAFQQSYTQTITKPGPSQGYTAYSYAQYITAEEPAIISHLQPTVIGTVNTTNGLQATGNNIALPQYGTVGNTNDVYVGSLNYSPLVENGNITLQYTGFSSTVVTATGTTQVLQYNPLTGKNQLTNVGYSYQGTTAYNPTTGRSASTSQAMRQQEGLAPCQM